MIDRELVIRKRLLERCIGRLIDVDSFDSFPEIGSLGIVDRRFARRVAACAGLRNSIAHEYDEIDPERVHAALTNALGDLPEWIRAIQEFLERDGPARV